MGAFVVDRLMPGWRRFRDFRRLDDAYRRISKFDPIAQLPSWLFVLSLVVIPVILVSLLQVLVDGIFGQLLLFLLNLFIAFVCLDFSVLTADDNNSNDSQPAEDAGAEDIGSEASVTIFARSNPALYTPVFWMVLAGPLALVFYRLLERLPQSPVLKNHQDSLSIIRTLTAWLEWLPAILSGLLFMLCGNFDAGWKELVKTPLLEDDLARLNQTRLNSVGLAAMNAAPQSANPVDSVKQAGDLCLRALLVWFLLATVYEWLISA
ncbi:MAG: AmpE protein [Planctomycetota bacterium]|jgi:AmpE protein